MGTGNKASPTCRLYYVYLSVCVHIHLLIYCLQATADLEDIDTKRRKEFKNYELEKEHLRRKELNEMDEAKRAEAERKHEEMRKKHSDHPKLHHPVGRHLCCAPCGSRGSNPVCHHLQCVVLRVGPGVVTRSVVICSVLCPVWVPGQ